MTTKQVVDTYVREECREGNEAFIDCAGESIPARIRQHAYWDQPTVFVSHAWGALFNELLSGLERFFELNELDEENNYLWINIFIINQADRPFEPRQALDAGLGTAGRLVLVLDDAVQPRALGRLWPLYEFHYALRENLNKEIALGRDQEHRLLESLYEEEAITIYNSLANITAQQVEHTLNTAKSEDGIRIREDIRRNYGFPNFADQLRNAFHNWLRSWLQARREQSRGDDWATNTSALARALQQFPRSQDDVEEAETLYCEMLQNIGSMSPKFQPAARVNARTNLAKVFQEQGDSQRAIDQWHRMRDEAQERNMEINELEASVNILKYTATNHLRTPPGINLDDCLTCLRRYRTQMEPHTQEYMFVSNLYMDAKLAASLFSARLEDWDAAYEWNKSATQVASEFPEQTFYLKRVECYRRMCQAEDLMGARSDRILQLLESQREDLRRVYTEDSLMIQEVNEMIAQTQLAAAQPAETF